MDECGQAKTDPMAPGRPQAATSPSTSVFVGVRKSTERKLGFKSWFSPAFADNFPQPPYLFEPRALSPETVLRTPVTSRSLRPAGIPPSLSLLPRSPLAITSSWTTLALSPVVERSFALSSGLFCSISFANCPLLNVGVFQGPLLNPYLFSYGSLPGDLTHPGL